MLHAYLAENGPPLARRPEQPGEVTTTLAGSPSHDLTPPTGLLLLARRDGVLAGRAGLR
ncbi:hypothetical protein ABZV78_30985 [Micromonospora sp. NPDC004540]|uniref:hypothetical protein n=1 Tax=Micromonospora sp. NPDC004540 TaxID=3154457 RepID=UPI0033ABCEFD